MGVGSTSAARRRAPVSCSRRMLRRCDLPYPWIPTRAAEGRRGHDRHQGEDCRSSLLRSSWRPAGPLGFRRTARTRVLSAVGQRITIIPVCPARSITTHSGSARVHHSGSSPWAHHLAGVRLRRRVRTTIPEPSNHVVPDLLTRDTDTQPRPRATGAADVHLEALATRHPSLPLALSGGLPFLRRAQPRVETNPSEDLSRPSARTPPDARCAADAGECSRPQRGASPRPLP